MKNFSTRFLLPLTIALLACASCKDDMPEGPEAFIDNRDGQEYSKVKIGNQVWMGENLNYDPGTSGGLYYDNDSITNHVYGRLYLWETVLNGESPSTLVPSGVQGLCPDGWHLPSIAEWESLKAYLESNDLDGRDIMDTVLWSNLSIPTNSTGFCARPAGTMYDGGESSANINSSTHFMSSTGTLGISLSGMSVNAGGGFSKVTNLGVYNYWSCRCIED